MTLNQTFTINLVLPILIIAIKIIFDTEISFYVKETIKNTQFTILIPCLLLFIN